MTKRELNPAIAGLVFVGFVLIILFIFRFTGAIHSPIMLFYKYPLLWQLPLFAFVLIVAGVFLFFYFKKEKKERPSYHRGNGADTPIDLILVWSLFLIPIAFIAASFIAPVLTAKATYDYYKPKTAASLPQSSNIGLIPKEVALHLSKNSFSSSTENLSNAHLIKKGSNLIWTFGQSPDGIFRRVFKKTAGSASLLANSTSRDIDFQKEEFKIAPGHFFSDSLTWKLYKKDYFSTIAESIYLPDEKEILVPFIKYEGLFVKVPVLGGAYLVSSSGDIETLSSEEAERRVEILGVARLFPESLARKIQESYSYAGGIWNRFFAHRDVLKIKDDENYKGVQPHFSLIENEGFWVSVAEPWGRAGAVGGIFFTDSITGKTTVWRPDLEEGLTSSAKAAEATKALAIPGVSFKSGDFIALEPRPFFVKGKLFFLVSIAPSSLQALSKSVIIDPATNKAVRIFSHDDPGADLELEKFIKEEYLPEDSLAFLKKENKKKSSTPFLRIKKDTIESLIEENEQQGEILEKILERYEAEN